MSRRFRNERRRTVAGVASGINDQGFLGGHSVTGRRADWIADRIDRISDPEIMQLRSLRGTVFDRRFLHLHIASETGAAEMAESEIHGGKKDAALALAKAIATAPTTQIPELRRLLAMLG